MTPGEAVLQPARACDARCVPALPAAFGSTAPALLVPHAAAQQPVHAGCAFSPCLTDEGCWSFTPPPPSVVQLAATRFLERP